MVTEQLPQPTTPASRTTEPVHVGWLASFRIDPLIMRIFIWTGVALVAATIVGFGWLMHLVPPPSPSDSPGETLAWVQDHQISILIGAALVTFFWSFWVTWAAPIILYIRRMERQRARLAFPPAAHEAAEQLGGASSIHQHVLSLQDVGRTSTFYTLDVEPHPRRPIPVEGDNALRLSNFEYLVHASRGRQAHSPQVVAQVEVRISCPQRWPHRNNGFDDFVREPRHNMHRPLVGFDHLRPFWRRIEDHHNHTGPRIRRWALGSPHQGVERIEFGFASPLTEFFKRTACRLPHD
jgi:hypothetical protein